MLTLRSGLVFGLIAGVEQLAALAVTVGLSGLGWAAGLTCAVVLNAVVVRGLVRFGADALGPADLVTLARATCACGVAALVADSFLQPPATTPLLALTVAALLLDAVDGWVARRTRTSKFGALFDGEVDAFLILVLSVYVAASVGWWVLAIGAARYVFAVAGRGLPWLRGQLPPRYWRKVVAATQGIVLAFAAADVMPRALTQVALVGALVLLAESFGRDVWWLRRHRYADGDVSEQDRSIADGGRPAGGRRRWRAVADPATNVLALLLVWFALVAPNQAHHLTPSAFLRIPAEGLVVACLAVVLPSLARRIMAAVVGVFLGLLAILKILDMGFFAALDRPFNLVTDPGYFGSAVDLVKDSIGQIGAVLAVVAAAVLFVALLVCMPLSVGRLSGAMARHRTWSVRTLTGLVVIWLAFSVSGLQIEQGQPIASTDAGRLAIGQVRAFTADVRDEEKFEAAVAVDHFRDAPEAELLTGLRGKDVLVVFVESYGRISIEGSPSSPQIQALLDASTSRLSASGYSSKSAYLTSSTFGGLSWLAHATLQSGLWIDNQRRYERLLSSNRMTLTRAFGRAGWRTFGVLPSNRRKWPAGKTFYQFDKVFDRRSIGYVGPRFGFSLMPDQFALSAFQRQVLAKRNRPPVMAEIDLASSHAPWATIPRMIPWDRLGDGSVFNRMAEDVEIPVGELWDDPDDVKEAYGKSVAYSLRSVISFVEKYGDENLVLVLLGDHQPATVVTGHGASRNVPVTIIAHDTTVTDRIAGWGWQDGMRPDPQAPVWRMDAFRDRFLDAYSPQPPQIPSRPAPLPQR